MNALTICRKEMTSYFRSPIAYTVMALWAVLSVSCLQTISKPFGRPQSRPTINTASRSRGTKR